MLSDAMERAAMMISGFRHGRLLPSEKAASSLGRPQRALQIITHVVPARYFLVALRGIVLKGITFQHLLPQLGALAVYAAAMLGLASLRLAKDRG